MIDLASQCSPTEVFYGIRTLQMLLDTKEDNGKSWKIDPQAYPVLLQLNRIPGVATTWCCQGHPKFARNKWHPSKMYYAMVADEPARKYLRAFCEVLFVHLTKVFEHEHDLKGEKNPAWIVRYVENHLRCHETDTWYKSTCIEARSSNPDYLEVINTEIAVFLEQQLTSLPQHNYARMQDDLNLITSA